MTKKKSVEKPAPLGDHKFVPGRYIVEHEHGNLWGPHDIEGLDDIPDNTGGREEITCLHKISESLELVTVKTKKITIVTVC